ncbi:MAG TPA: hypothetical protein ENJ91_08860 [Rhodobacteraceae bacterium]|nr:hypothetical protein [Paracoccaceae bacterium]
MPIPDAPGFAALAIGNRQAPADRALKTLGQFPKIWHGSHMTTYDNSYSRFIAWTKVILPIIALGILSTLFLFSKNVDPTLSIPYAKVDVEGLAREQRVGAPNYAGVTSDGSAISITAQSAHPNKGDSGKVSALDLSAIIEDTDGARIEITSGKGFIDSRAQIATLSDHVHIKTSTGYVVDTNGLIASLDKTEMVTDGRVTANGPLGSLNAGQMELRSSEENDGSHLLVFKGGVKLIYDPKGS